MEIIIRFRGSRSEAIAAVRRAAAVPDSSELRAALVRIGLAALGKIHTAYLTKSAGGTDETGTRWAPLSPVTIRRRRYRPSYRVHQGFPILRDTDALLTSLKPASDPQNALASPPVVPGQVFTIEQYTVTVGTKVPYAHFHQAGIPAKMPARPPVPRVSSWPSSWWQALLEEARTGFIEMLKSELAR